MERCESQDPLKRSGTLIVQVRLAVFVRMSFQIAAGPASISFRFYNRRFLQSAGQHASSSHRRRGIHRFQPGQAPGHDGHDVTVVDDFSSGHWSNLVEFTGDVITADTARPPPMAEVDSRPSRSSSTRHRSPTRPCTTSGG